MELFEREARMLQSLQHPRIPRLLDFFHEQNPEGVVLTMVMEHIAGPTLAERLDGGWRPPEAEVLEIARQGLELLKWLHGRQPTALHRDIKPSNLIWTDTGELYLIDFGAVKELFISKGSSTVIGTFGYMAPEQFIGQSVPASDLYGLGATLLHLLAGRAPAEIPQLGLRLDFRPYVSCSIE
ncbi:MAG TPA: serine/threonine-protein kinase, partial [Candidatus Obscuribacterales bacterium]